MIRLNFRKAIRVGVLAIAAIACLPAAGQDLLARQAPVDRKMRAVDSISIMRLISNETLENPAGDLYPSWDNKYVRYSSANAPSEYKIDLRNFCMPCKSRVVTSHYGYRRQFRRNHYGTDIKVYVGDTIRAAFSGKVRVVSYEGKGYGKYVIIRHPNGLETVYGHMSKQLVKENVTVNAGDPIGLGGSTGRSTAPHLHFETRFLGEYINPEKLFSFEARDVLADYYVYRRNGRGDLVNSRNVGGESEVEEEALAKAEESREFQQERMQSVRRTQIHKVKKGDTLYSIAKKYHMTVDQLCRLNNISKKKTLSVGQIIKCS